MTEVTLESPRTSVETPALRRKLSVKKLLMTVAIVGLCVGLVSYGRYWWETGRFLESTDDAYVGGNVTVIAPKVAGFIATVEVADNQVVKAGDILFRIDDRDYQAALSRAKANVAAQEAALTNLDALRRLQESVVTQAMADVQATDAEATRTHFDFVRYRDLSSTAYASRQRFEQADADWKRASAANAKALASVDAAKRQIDVIDSQKGQALAALDQAKADLQIADLNLGYTIVRSPIDGVVGNRSAREGSYASVGYALVSIVPAQGLWVDANFKENQLAKMHPGEKAEVVADVLPGETFSGHVVSLAPATGAQFSVLPPENATGNFTKIVQRVPVRILLDGDASTLGRLRPGLSVTASVDQRLEKVDRQSSQGANRGRKSSDPASMSAPMAASQ